MTTVGGAISGYCATGRTCEAINPASVIMIAMTPAKIGRLMKNSENDIAATLLVVGLDGRARRCRRRRGGCGRRRLGHRRARLHLEQVVDHDSVAGIEAGENRPVLSDPVSRRDRSRLHLPVGTNDENQISLLRLEN